MDRVQDIRSTGRAASADAAQTSRDLREKSATDAVDADSTALSADIVQESRNLRDDDVLEVDLAGLDLKVSPKDLEAAAQFLEGRKKAKPKGRRQRVAGGSPSTSESPDTVTRSHGKKKKKKKKKKERGLGSEDWLAKLDMATKGDRHRSPSRSASASPRKGKSRSASASRSSRSRSRRRNEFVGEKTRGLRQLAYLKRNPGVVALLDTVFPELGAIPSYDLKVERLGLGLAAASKLVHGKASKLVMKGQEGGPRLLNNACVNLAIVINKENNNLELFCIVNGIGRQEDAVLEQAYLKVSVGLARKIFPGLLLKGISAKKLAGSLSGDIHGEEFLGAVLDRQLKRVYMTLVTGHSKRSTCESHGRHLDDEGYGRRCNRDTDFMIVGSINTQSPRLLRTADPVPAMAAEDLQVDETQPIRRLWDAEPVYQDYPFADLLLECPLDMNLALDARYSQLFIVMPAKEGAGPMELPRLDVSRTPTILQDPSHMGHTGAKPRLLRYLSDDGVLSSEADPAVELSENSDEDGGCDEDFE